MATIRTLVVGAVLLAGAACTAGPPAATPPAATPAGSPPAGSPGTSPAADGPVLPLDRYLLTPAEDARLNRAHRLLIERCTRRFGLAMPAVAASPPPPGGPNARRYGINDPATARLLGYRVRAGQPPADRRSPDPTRSADLTLEAVLGGRGASTVNGRRVPPGGCFGEARRRLSGGVAEPADMFLAQRLNQDSFGAARGHPRVRAVVEAWSACMRAAGFRYADPLRPPADPLFRAAVTERETRTATADVACKRRTGLVAVWSAVEANLQRSYIATHRARLEEIRRVHRAQLAAAATVDRAG